VVSYASSLFFDVAVLIFSALKLKEVKKQSIVARQAHGDSLAYFVLATTANATILAIQSLPESFQMIKPAAVGFATLINTAVAQRVFLNLKLLSHRKDVGLVSRAHEHASIKFATPHKPALLSAHVIFPDP
jgi:hypothetical protein